MVASLTYRTSDATRWGGGLASDLTAVQVDLNFWTLFSAVQVLQNTQAVNAGIDYINQPNGGNLFYVHLTNHAVLGPFVIPTAKWNPRGAWLPNTAYAAYDVVAYNGAAYLITIPHTSGTTFSALSTDGQGNLLYTLLLQQPANQIPVGGTPGQRLAKSGTADFAMTWLTDRVRLALFVEGKPLSGELVLQYCVSDNITFPASLVGSVIFSNTPSTAPAVFQINKNGSSIGTVTFAASPHVTIIFPSAVSCIAGDIISLTAPSPQDATLADVSFSFVANLTL